MHEYFTRIPNTIIKDNDIELNEKELLIASMVFTTLNSKSICTFTIQMLYDLLNIKSNNTRSRNQIKEALKTFEKLELFQYYKNTFVDNESIIKADDIKINTLVFAYYPYDIESFTKLKDIEFKKIINYSLNNEIDIYLLFKTMLYILSYINENKQEEYYKLAFPTLATLKDKLNITEKTLLKYINILKDLNILTFDYAGITITKDNEVRNGNLFYCRPEDEKYLTERLIKEREEKGFIKISKLNKDKIKLKTTLTQKINYLKNKTQLSELEQDKLNRLTIERQKLDEK